jgi:hypothetical protein
MGRLMEKIIIQAIDCCRHDYWKVSLDLLNELNIIEAISEYSYLGNTNDTLNEEGYAYLEIDSDCGIFDKAMKFYKKEFQLDFDTLQEKYDEEYEDYRDWLDQLDQWDTETIEEKGQMWDMVPEDLIDFINGDSEEENENE